MLREACLLLAAVAAGRGALALQEVWLVSIQPFTGADWDAGVSMRVGAEIILEEVNAHSALLPGYELKVVWQDGMCAGGVGTNLFLKNLFDKTYESFAPGVPVDQLDADGSGIITTSDTAPLAELWNSSKVSPDPVGLLGPGCSGTALNIAFTAFKARIPMVSNSASRPALSDRSAYPNFFRTILPDTFYTNAWVAMARALGMTRVGVLIGDTENWGSMGVKFAEAAAGQGLAMVGIDLSDEIAGFSGVQVSIESLAAARAAALELARMKQRVVVTIMYQRRARLVMCEAYKIGMANTVFMFFGWFAYGWWSVEDTDCTGAQLTAMATGFVQANMMFWRADEDQVLSCSESLTSAQFKSEWFSRQGLSMDDLAMTPEGYSPALEAATTADAVCMYAQMLHEVLISRAVPLADLAARTPAAYEAVQEVLGTADFEGVQGRVRFEPGQADPKGFVILQQLQEGGVIFDIASYNHPTLSLLGKGDLVFGLGEVISAGPSGASALPGQIAAFRKCPEGQMLNMSSNQCMDCPEGQVFLDILGACACRAGYVSSPGGGCAACGAGNFTGSAGQNECDRCQPGRFAEGSAQTECKACPVGAYQPALSATACVGCDGAGRKTTMVEGADNTTACVCARGFFRRSAGGECEDCPVGMDCEAGSSTVGGIASQYYPRVEEGFMTIAGDPLQVYKCVQVQSCPGGVTGKCADYRDVDKVACASCVDGAYESGQVCEPCSGSTDVAPFILVGIAGCVGLAVMTFMVNRNLLMQTNTTMMCVVMVALMFTGIQTLGIFQQVSIEWFEPLAAILELTSLLSFNLKVVKVGCVLGINPVSNFIFRQMVAPMTIPVVAVVLCVKKYFQPGTRVVLELVNTVGTLFNVFFISIVLSGTSPLVCYRHPPFTADSLTSMISEPSVLCGEGGVHTQMVVVGVMAMFVVPIPFMAMASVFTWKYPSYVSRGHEYLHAMRFLFFRFHAAKYYYGIILLSRSLIICLIPIIPGLAGDTALQTWVMTACICGYTLVQQQLNPWRSYVANIMDGLISMTLILLLMTGVMATDLQANMDSIKVAGVIAFACFIALVFGTLAVGLYLKFRPNPWYNYFICHHKGHAAAQARLLKVLIQNRSRLSVFIDSDDLQELDTLFDIVKCKLEHLLVYLTRDTLSRPWCAGEIVTAFNSPTVKVTAIKTPSFIPPTEDQILSLDTFLDLSSCNLEEYNIATDAVAAAFRQLLRAEAPCVLLQAGVLGSAKFDLLAGEFLSRASPAGAAGEASAGSKGLPPIPIKSMVLISSLPSSDEATAAACILNNKIREDVLRVAEEGICLLADHDPDLDGIAAAVARSRAVIVLLTQGTMESLPQLVAIVELMSTVASVDASPPQVIPVNTPGFSFPDAAYYEAVLPRIWPGDPAGTAAIVQSFFKRIAVFFATNASDSVLDTQAREVLSRIPKKFDTQVGLTRTMTGSALRSSLQDKQTDNTSDDDGFDPNELREI